MLLLVFCQSFPGIENIPLVRDSANTGDSGLFEKWDFALYAVYLAARCMDYLQDRIIAI